MRPTLLYTPVTISILGFQSKDLTYAANRSFCSHLLVLSRDTLRSWWEEAKVPKEGRELNVVQKQQPSTTRPVMSFSMPAPSHDHLLEWTVESLLLQ